MVQTTVVIPTFNRPQMCEIAMKSVLAQTTPCELIIMNDGGLDGYEYIKEYQARSTSPFSYFTPQRADNCFLTWADGVYRAQGEYVMILADDDWLEPDAIEVMQGIMNHFKEEIVYCTSQTFVHYIEDDLKTCSKVERGLPSAIENSFGVIPKENFEQFILELDASISPHCCLFEKELLLDSIVVNRIPYLSFSNTLCGYDTFIMLLQLLLSDKKYIGLSLKNLVNFGAHSQSETMKAYSTPESKQSFFNNYKEVKVLYRKLKEYNAQNTI